MRDLAYALLDSGATHVLLPGHMLPRGARKEVHAKDRAHPLLPHGRLANLLDTKFIWENGQAFTQLLRQRTMEDHGQVEVRNNMAYASQLQFEVLRVVYYGHNRLNGRPLEILGEGSLRPEDVNLFEPGCEGEDV